MLLSILGRLGLYRPKSRKTVTTVRLDIIAEQVREFNEAKRQINDKITVLESKTSELDAAVLKTLDLTLENESRLDNIEKNLGKIVAMSEAYLAGKVNQASGYQPAEEEKSTG